MNVTELIEERNKEVFEELSTFKYTDTEEYVLTTIGKKFNLAPITVKNILKKMRKKARGL